MEILITGYLSKDDYRFQVQIIYLFKIKKNLKTYGKDKALQSTL